MLHARQLLAGLSAPIDPAFVMVDLYTRPSALIPGIEAGAGLLGIIAYLAWSLKYRRAVPTASSAATQVDAAGSSLEPPPIALETSSVPATVSESMSQRVRGLMLLNLPRDAGPDDVEFAPPLGTRQQVLDILGNLMPGIRFDPRGWCVFSRPDHAIVLDIGPGEPIATAVIDAEGEGAVAAVRNLMTSTGWRAFAPRLGRFLEADEIA